MLINTGPTPFQWVSDNIHMVGWGTIMALAIWVWRKSIEVTVGFKESQKASKTAVAQIDQLATEHFPEMRTNLTALNTKTEKANEILSSIDKGIAVIVDRGHQYSGPERRTL